LFAIELVEISEFTKLLLINRVLNFILKSNLKQMKKIIAIFCLLISMKSNAQQDTSKVEQYCEVVATGRILSNKVTIDIDYGEARSIWKDKGK
jgi:hypothetical protein